MKAFILPLILAALIALPSAARAALASDNPMLHAARGAVLDGQKIPGTHT